MALSKRAKIALGVLTLGVGYVVYDQMTKAEAKPSTGGKLTSRPSAPSGSMTPGTSPPGRVTLNEPEEGWQARLVAHGPEAVEACRDDESVTTYAQAQACILGRVFPEQPPWGGSTDLWHPWMFDARQGVRDLIRDQVQADVGSVGAPGWQFTGWLLLDRYFDTCEDIGDAAAVTACILQKMHPQESWPPREDDSGWKKQLHNYVLERVQIRLYGPGVRA